MYFKYDVNARVFVPAARKILYFLCTFVSACVYNYACCAGVNLSCQYLCIYICLCEFVLPIFVHLYMSLWEYDCHRSSATSIRILDGSDDRLFVTSIWWPGEHSRWVVPPFIASCHHALSQIKRRVQVALSVGCGLASCSNNHSYVYISTENLPDYGTSRFYLTRRPNSL